MQPENRDLALLWDIQQASRDIVTFTNDVQFHEFSANKMLRFAVERQLLVVGEASKHISAAFKNSHPDIPWEKMAGLRNVLAHDYGEILVERVWFTATKSIPALITALNAVLPPSE